MKTKLKAGFTLIELLVVIAIIGVLSAVIVGQLNTSRERGADAAIKKNLADMRTQVELLFGDTNSYSTVCSTAKPQSMYDAACSASVGGVCSAGTNGRCWNNVGNWGAWVQMKSNTANAWCVDNTGASRQIVKPVGVITSCP